MNTDLSKAYELLGVKPGVSPRDLKAAHRDLAKVWHPDRFLHDPRLQEKAQEKLKEINEAYELLSMGPRPQASRPQASRPVYSNRESRVTQRRSSSLQWALVPLLLCLVVFAITTKVLQQRARSLSQQEQVEQPATAPQESAAQTERDSRSRAVATSPKEIPADAAAEVALTETTSSQPAPAVATVTVTIDPESGLLAKRDCPVRSRMTYPSGSEPNGYCNINHAPPPKDSKIKSLAKSVTRAID